MSENKTLDIDQIIQNLLSIHPLLTKSLNRSIKTKTNLNPGSLFILGLLNRHETLSMSEIGCKLSMPKPHVTAQIDKLIAEEMVERLFDPNDRRIINISMTKKGKEDFTQIVLDISMEMRQNLELLEGSKINELLDSTSKIRKFLLDTMTENSTPCGK